MESPFDVLRVDEGADKAEIERAYRRRVLEVHPDQGGSIEEFQRVRAAYEELTSESERTERGSVYGDVADPAADEDEEEEDDRSRVEYLNYEVLDDYGWSLDDEDLFEKASAADLDPDDYGRFLAEPDESLLEAAENRGFAWPYACRGGACANCAVAVTEGEVEMPADHILPQDMLDRGMRLSCNGVPATDEIRVVYNVKRRPGLDELRLPPTRFKRAHLND